VLRFNNHTFAQFLHTNADIGLAIYFHNARRTSSYGAKKAPRAIEMLTSAQHSYAGCMQCRSDWLSFIPGQLLAVKQEVNFSALGEGQDGMICNSQNNKPPCTER
jgi:hypothetical protein